MGQKVQGGVCVQFEDVGLVYGHTSDALCALDQVTFTVNPGKSIALIGPSGCGKSTLLHVAAGLLHPTSGCVRIDNSLVSAPRKTTAFIPQDLGLFPWKTALDNVALGLRLHHVSAETARQQARKALADVGLEGFEDAWPKDLSGGMRQRLSLARALAMDADLVLMDEPLSAIDALLRESLQDLLLNLWLKRGHTQVVVTHSIQEAVFLGQEIIVMSSRPGTLRHVIQNPRVGSTSYRDHPEYAEVCRQVRSALSKSSVAEELQQVSPLAPSPQSTLEQSHKPMQTQGRDIR